VWWIRYADADGDIHREKVGGKGAAIKLYQKRKTQVLQGEKLPELTKKRVVKFSEIADDALKYCEAHNQGHKFDAYRIGRLKAKFGDYRAEIPIEYLRQWFDDQKWEPGTCNRYKSTLSLAYRLAMENGKAKNNPARLLKRKREDNGRVRFLNQFTPLKTELEYLKPCTDEETRFRAVIRKRFPTHMHEFDVALHTGMRPSEQYNLTWDRVDLVRKLITLPKTKNGKTRHIPLNSIVAAIFQGLFDCSSGQGRVFVTKDGVPLKGYKHWFDDVVKEAGIKEFTWYCLRHTFASRLVMAGVDIRTVAELMGHKTIQMTMRYAHLAQQHKQDAVERLVEAVAAQSDAGKSDAPQKTPTGTRTDTSVSGEVEARAANVN
jgi:integrase